MPPAIVDFFSAAFGGQRVRFPLPIKHEISKRLLGPSAQIRLPPFPPSPPPPTTHLTLRKINNAGEGGSPPKATKKIINGDVYQVLLLRGHEIG